MFVYIFVWMLVCNIIDIKCIHNVQSNLYDNVYVIILFLGMKNGITKGGDNDSLDDQVKRYLD